MIIIAVADKTALVSNKEATRRNQVGTDEIILPKTIAFESILATVQDGLGKTPS